MTTTLSAPESSRTMLRAVARGGIANLAGTAFTGVAGVGVTWLVVRTLDPAAAGAFFSAIATFVLGVTIAKLGTQTSLVYWPAKLRAAGDPDALPRCLRVALVPVALSAIGLAAALWFGAGLVPGDPAYLRVLALYLPAAALFDAALAATRGFRAMRPTVLLDKVLRPGGQVVLLTFVWLAGGGPTLLAAVYALPFVPAAMLAGYALARLVRVEGTAAEGTGEPFTARAYWRFAAPRGVASMAQTALQRVDVLLVAALAGLAPAAVYTVAGRFVVLGQFVNAGLSQAVQPRLAERLSTGDTAGANVLYRQATAWLVLLNWPIYLLVIVYAPVSLGLFGAQYRHGAPIVVVMAAAMLVATACGMVDMVLAMGGRTWWNLANVALALAVMLAVDLAMIPRHGALGAAFGLAAAVLTNNLVPLVQVARGLSVHPFGRATLTAAALATGCFAVPQLLLLPLAADTALKAAVTAAGAGVYVFVVVRLRTLLLGAIK